jgi:hypothetical protein
MTASFVYDDGVTPWSVIRSQPEFFRIVRADNLSTYVGVAEFRRGTVKVQQFEPMSADFRTWFQVDGGIVKLKHIDLLTDGARSHLSGYVNFRNWPEQEYRIQSVVDLTRMRELFWSKRAGGCPAKVISQASSSCSRPQGRQGHGPGT